MSEAPSEFTGDDMERAVLGAILRDNQVMADVLGNLQPSDFRMDAHQTIYRAMIWFWDQQKPIDLVSLADRLNDEQTLGNIGGYDYIARVWDATPTAANVEYYARRVKKMSVRRRLEYALRSMLGRLERNEGSEEDLLTEAEAEIFAIAEMGVRGDAVPLLQAIGEALDRIDVKRTQPTSRGLLTGFAGLDKRLCGLQQGELIIVAARTSIGKTAFAWNVAVNVAQAGASVLFLSLEQDRIDLADRLLSREANVRGFRIREGSVSTEEVERLMACRSAFANSKLFIDHCPGQALARIAASARRLKRSHGLGLIVVDYLQLIEPDNRRDTRQEQVATSTRRLKQLARDLRIPVLALAQLNREADQAPPRLSHLRDSGAIEQDADTVLLLHQQDDGLVLVNVAKQRNGPTGEIDMRFNKDYMRFENYVPPIP